MRLPGEEELRQSIQRDYSSELQVASDLLNIGTGIFTNPNKPKPKDEIENYEWWICLGIVVKACRQYRGLVALAELGLGDVAESIGRMLSETMLTAEFLMRPNIVLKQGPKLLKEVPGYPLTTRFRTKLYIAHDAASKVKTLREMVKYGNIKALDADRIVKEAEQDASNEASEIGVEWAKRQKVSGSYSGLSVIDLVNTLGFSPLYHAFYRPSSAGIHGTDAMKFVRPEELPNGCLAFNTYSNDDGVFMALQLGSVMLLNVLKVTNQRFGFQLEEQLGEIGKRIDEMTKQEKTKREREK